MSRLETSFLAVLSLVTGTGFGQTPDVLGASPAQEELVRLLASGPRDVAWAADAIVRQNRQEMIPNLAAQIASYRGELVPDRGSVPPEAAAMEAVADALIRLQATLPAGTVMHLYPQFPAQTIILLSRASDNTNPLMEIFQMTTSRDLWLAAGNLLTLHPTPEFVRSLLGGVVASFTFHVVPPSSDRSISKLVALALLFVQERSPSCGPAAVAVRPLGAAGGVQASAEVDALPEAVFATSWYQ